MDAELCDDLLVTTSLFISLFPYFQLLGSEYVVLGTATTLQTEKKCISLSVKTKHTVCHDLEQNGT